MSLKNPLTYNLWQVPFFSERNENVDVASAPYYILYYCIKSFSKRVEIQATSLFLAKKEQKQIHQCLRTQGENIGMYRGGISRDFFLQLPPFGATLTFSSFGSRITCHLVLDKCIIDVHKWTKNGLAVVLFQSLEYQYVDPQHIFHFLIKCSNSTMKN